MTISSEVRKAGPFDGNDVADTFPFSFKVFTVADLMVVRADSLGAETVLTLGTDYTVSLNPNQNESPGGSVVTTSPLAAGFKLVLTSKVGNLQPVDLTNQGGFYPEVINGALDRLTILAQQLRVDVDRSAKLPITREEDADELLADVVLIADNMAAVNTVSGNIANVIEVSGISEDVTTVAGVAPSVPVVAAIDGDVATVAGIASDIPSVAASAANIDAVAADLANVNTVAANIGSVNATAPEIDSVVEVAEHMPDILAALADLPSLAAKVSKTGDTMTGPLEVPAGARGAQVPRAQETLLRFGASDPLPTSDIGPIWHDGYGGILTWQEIGSYEGYASARLAEVTFRAVDDPLPGTLVANGATVSRTTYAALFAAIGTTFGVGDGSTTFKLPDLRGEFIRGWDAGRGEDAGRAFGSAQGHAFASHTHPLNNVYSNREGSPNWKVGLGAEVHFNYQGFSTNAAGGTETRPRNIALLPMIYY